MYPIFEPGQKKFSDHNNNDWDSLNQDLWVCEIFLWFQKIFLCSGSYCHHQAALKLKGKRDRSNMSLEERSLAF